MNPFYRDVRIGDITDIGVINEVYEDLDNPKTLTALVLDRDLFLNFYDWPNTDYKTKHVCPSKISINYSRLRRQIDVLDVNHRKPSYRATARQIANLLELSFNEAYTKMFAPSFKEEILEKISKKEQIIVKRINESSRSFGL